MKKNLLSLLLIIGVVFSSCKKDDPVVPTDPRDKFVGTWSGTTKLYESGVLIYTGASSYTIIKDANNSAKVLINDAPNGLVNVPATVTGNTYTISNYTTSDADFSYVSNATGVINGNTINENASTTETDLLTGDIVNYTSVTILSK